MAVKIMNYPIYGDTGLAVARVQKLLAKTGSKIQETGKFTIGMVSAIKSFQKKAGLKVTGKLDKLTMDALKAYKAPKK
jgi:peptidoglycan hydrolase-like protein with peptidoglycan-binding domain